MRRSAFHMNRTKLRIALFQCILVVLVTVVSFASATAQTSGTPSDDQPVTGSTPGESLDDVLLESLGGDVPVVDRPEAADRKQSETPAGADLPEPAGQPPLDDLDRELLRGLGVEPNDRNKQPADDAAGSDVGPPDSDPLVALSRRMRQVEQRLGLERADDETKRMQRDILDDLAKLIEQARQQSQQSSSSSTQQQSSASQRRQVTQPELQPGQQQAGQPKEGPSRDSTERIGRADAQAVDASGMSDLLKDVWGELPPRVREQMRNSFEEQFLPKYELQIREYFKALVRERETNR